MSYKNKDRQREAVRLATRRYRQRQKVSQGATLVIPIGLEHVIPPKPKPACAVRPAMPALPEPTEITEQPMKSGSRPEPQSYNSMMVGYVPPTE